MRYLCLIVLWIGLSLATQAQNLFISSDGAIFMEMSAEWTIEETEVGIVNLTDTQRNINIMMNYGRPLHRQLIQDNPEVDLEALIPIRVAVLMSRKLGIEPDIFVELPFQQEVFWYAHDKDDDAPHSFVMESSFTGITHITISGSETPYEDFLQVWLAYETPADPPFDCSQLQLDQSQALPGAVLLLDGLPYGLGDFEMQAIADDVEDIMPLIAIAQEDNSFLTAPLYPDLRLEGGSVTIQAIYNGNICKEIPFTVQPMPESPGELDRFVEAGNRYINATLNFLDIEREDIMQAPIPDALIPVAEVQFMLDHPDNPNSLVNVMQTADPETIRFMEAIFANDGYVDYLNGFSDFLLEQPPLPPIGTAENTLYLSTEFKPWQVNEFDILRKVEIKDVEKLSYYMRFQSYWQNFDGGNVLGKLGLANSSAGLVVNGLSQAGKISSKAASRAGAVGAIISTGLLVGSNMVDLYRHLLPSKFTQVRPVLSLTRYLDEDNEKVHKLEKVTVSVTSKKWDVTKNVADAVITLVGAAGAGKGIHDAAKGTSTYGAIDNVFDATTSADFASNICGTVGGSDCNSDKWSIGPYTWSNIDLEVDKNQGLYVNFQIDSRQSGANPSINIKNVIQYEAVDDGLTVLRVRPKPAAFGGATLPRRVTVLVDKIAVYITAPQTAEPGNQVCATSPRVNHALDESLEWRLIGRTGQIGEPVITKGNAPHEFCFTMPEPSQNDLTTTESLEECKATETGGFVVTAESTTRTGAREHNSDEPRIGTASIFTTDEYDICEGLWTVVARDELNDFCVRDGVNQTDLQGIIDDLIAGGNLNSLLDIEKAPDRSFIDITDVMTDETQRYPRLYPIQNIEIIYGDVNVIGVNTNNTQVLDINPTPPPPRQFARVYAVPLPSFVTEVTPLTVTLSFPTRDSFVGSLSWDIQIKQTISGADVDVTCDIDFIYDGTLNK